MSLSLFVGDTSTELIYRVADESEIQKALRYLELINEEIMCTATKLLPIGVRINGTGGPNVLQGIDGCVMTPLSIIRDIECGDYGYISRSSIEGEKTVVSLFKETDVLTIGEFVNFLEGEGIKCVTPLDKDRVLMHSTSGTIGLDIVFSEVSNSSEDFETQLKTLGARSNEFFRCFRRINICGVPSLIKNEEVVLKLEGQISGIDLIVNRSIEKIKETLSSILIVPK